MPFRNQVFVLEDKLFSRQKEFEINTGIKCMQMKFGPAMPSYENWCAAASFQMRSNKTQTEGRLDCAATKTLKNQKGV